MWWWDYSVKYPPADNYLKVMVEYLG